MGFETSKFGYSTNIVTTVSNHYGQREVKGSTGVMNTSGAMNELVIDLDASMVTATAFPLLAPKLPAGAIIEDVYMEVTEAFVVSGTTPAIEIGTETSEATNGFTITEAQAEALGTYDLTSALSGTWAAGLAAETTLGIAMSGSGGPAVTSVGKARLVIRYARV